jgi:hypothetical protein
MPKAGIDHRRLKIRKNCGNGNGNLTEEDKSKREAARGATNSTKNSLKIPIQPCTNNIALDNHHSHAAAASRGPTACDYYY